MILMVGGYAQGKRALAQEKYRLLPAQFADGESCPLDAPPHTPALDRLHLLIRRLLLAGLDPQGYILRMVAQTPELLVIADEVGCGVVPIDRFEREWRECCGRICCLLAQRSERVERVVAGISTVIKEAKG